MLIVIRIMWFIFSVSYIIWAFKFWKKLKKYIKTEI